MTASQHTPRLDVATPEARAALAAVYRHLVRLARERRAEVVEQVRETFQLEQQAADVVTLGREPTPAAGDDLAKSHDREVDSTP